MRLLAPDKLSAPNAQAGEKERRNCSPQIWRLNEFSKNDSSFE